MAVPKIQCTKNYRLFSLSAENRPFNEAKHKNLRSLMELHGFLPFCPIVCVRDKKGNLIVWDGQHRLAFAESLGLPVYWIESSIEVDLAKFNGTPAVWALRDYAQKYAANGVAAYIEGLRFMEEHGMPIGKAFSLLAGTMTFENIDSQFRDGTFRIKDRKWAEAVARLYVPLSTLQPALKNTRFLEACMAVCRVKHFEHDRMLHSAERCREKLVPYSTRDAYLEMLETVYNFGRAKLVALRVDAEMALRSRNAVTAAVALKAEKAGAR